MKPLTMSLLPRIKAGLSSTTFINDVRGEHLNIFAFTVPVLLSSFWLKRVLILLEKRL